MPLFHLIWRNVLRHPLRSVLTALGIAIALFAFVMIQTLLDAWNAGVRQSARDRLWVRNSVSLIFPLPLSYYNTIAQVPGVNKLAYANWFDGIYKDVKYHFAQFAAKGYLDVYPEFVVAAEESRAYEADRMGALIGVDLAEKYDLKPGDRITLKGTIYPGIWDFNVRGIFHGREPGKFTRQMLFHWDYLNERVRTIP